MLHLKHIVDQTGASIVLSSTWREEPSSLRAVNAKLREHGLADCVGCTGAALDESDHRRRRGREIMDVVGKTPGLAGYVVLDDSDLTLGTDELDRAHFCRTDMGRGLTEADVHRAIGMLTNKAN